MARSIFEEVTEKSPEAPRPGAADADKRRNRARIASWLTLIAGMIALMVLIGGLTRLTDSGLSITEWNLVFGVAPPLSEAAWASEFDLYQTTDEFKQQNHAMTLAEFKTIYYWEWGHRLLGRVLGLAYLLPLLWFTWRKTIPAGWAGRLWLGFGLVALQGLIGWWMVQSGLVGRLDVAPYRLAAHLGMAFLLFLLCLWWIGRLRRDEADLLQARRRRVGRVLFWSRLVLAVAFLQVLAGALVAGLDAGKQFTDWPLMGGQFFPADTARAAEGWRNLFEDPGVTQFVHRMLAYGLIILAVVFWRIAAGGAHAPTRRWAGWAAAAVGLQAVLGIVTLTHGAAFHLALAHQMLALAVLGVIARAVFEAAYPAQTSLRG